MKFKVDEVRNLKTGKIAPVIVKSVLPCRIKDILIGGGAILFGIGYLTAKAFGRGAYAYNEAEFNALYEAGILVKTKDDGFVETDDYDKIEP